MEGGSAPGELNRCLREPLSLTADREAIIQACYELVCSGRSLSEILAEAGRLSSVAPGTITAVDTQETGSASALCAGASDAEKLQTADEHNAIGPAQAGCPSAAMSRTWPFVEVFILSLVVAICGVTAVGISQISIWSPLVERRDAHPVTSDIRRDPLPIAAAEATIVPINVSRANVIAPLTSAAATTGFEDYPTRDKHASEMTEPPSIARLKVLPSRRRAQDNGAAYRQRTTVPRARGISSSPSAIPQARPAWQYDRLIGQYVPLAGSGASRYR